MMRNLDSFTLIWVCDVTVPYKSDWLTDWSIFRVKLAYNPMSFPHVSYIFTKRNDDARTHVREERSWRNIMKSSHGPKRYNVVPVLRCQEIWVLQFCRFNGACHSGKMVATQRETCYTATLFGVSAYQHPVQHTGVPVLVLTGYFRFKFKAI